MRQKIFKIKGNPAELAKEHPIEMLKLTNVSRSFQQSHFYTLISNLLLVTVSVKLTYAELNITIQTSLGC